MKALITICIAGLTVGGYAQTKKIALKSHAGSMDELSMNENGNLGLGNIRIDPKKIEPLKIDTATRKAMIHDSVSTYKFLMDSTKSKPKVTEPKKEKSVKKEEKK